MTTYLSIRLGASVFFSNSLLVKNESSSANDNLERVLLYRSIPLALGGGGRQANKKNISKPFKINTIPRVMDFF